MNKFDRGLIRMDQIKLKAFQFSEKFYAKR